MHQFETSVEKTMNTIKCNPYNIKLVVNERNDGLHFQDKRYHGQPVRKSKCVISNSVFGGQVSLLGWTLPIFIQAEEL